MASLASKAQLLVLGEPASQFLNAGGKRPLDFSGWQGFAGGASREVSAWRKPALQNSSAVFFESCPSRKGQTGKE